MLNWRGIQLAGVFFDNVRQLYGLPNSIVSDRDMLFARDFWKELFRLQGMTLSFNSAYHVQFDGQSERVN